MTVGKPAASTLAGTVVYLQNCKTKNPVLVIIIMEIDAPLLTRVGTWARCLWEVIWHSMFFFSHKNVHKHRHVTPLQEIIPKK